MKILHLIDSLHYSGAARQLQLLGPALADANTSIEICCLGPETPWSESLRRAGVTVHTLGWTRWFDFAALWNLRAILRDPCPDVVHVWRCQALRVLAALAPGLLSRVVVSAPLPTRGKLAWWDRSLLGRVRGVVVAGPSDRDRCEREGIGGPVHVIPFATAKRGRSSFSEKGPDTFSIACVGNLERDEGFRNAIWAFDIIRHLHTKMRLQLVGSGSQLDALQSLANGLQNTSHLDFLGARADADEILDGADVVWIPSMANCGQQVALEAMAHGRPVIASDVACLRDVIRDGENGFLVAVGDVVAFARRTHALHQDVELQQRIGSTAREYVERNHALADAVEQWRALYHQFAGSAILSACAA